MRKLLKPRNVLLIFLAAGTLLFSGILPTEEQTVALPVASMVEAIDPLSAFKKQRTAQEQADMAALQTLINREDISGETREAAAAALAALVAARRIQSAMEGALANSSLAPCVVVFADGYMTLVTASRDISSVQSARIMELASLHAGVESSAIRVITAD